MTEHDPAAFEAIDQMVEEAEAQCKQILELVPRPYRDRYLAITEVTDAFCVNHLQPLHREYELYAQVLTTALLQDEEDHTPLLADRAKPASWAAGIIWALGRVNFLSDPSFEPAMLGRDVAKAIGVSMGTMQDKATRIWKYFDMIQFDPRWTLPSLAANNPLVWMVETKEGLIVDLRHAPRDVQEMAFEQDLIPYIPADKEGNLVADFDAADDTDDDDRDGVVGRIRPA